MIKRLALAAALVFFSLATFAQDIGGGLNNPAAAGSNGTVTSVTFTGDGTILSSTPSSAVTTTGTVTATLKNQTANTVLGAVTATTPSDLAVPSCSGASNALTWTTGTGFGCNTITAGAAAAGTLTGTTLASNVVTSSLTSAAGGAFGTGAYAAAYTLPNATSSTLGGVKVDNTTVTASSGVITAASSGFLNKIRNGNMLISQRMVNNTTTACSTTPGYTIDGWICGATGANAAIFWENAAFTATTGENPAYIPAYMKILGAASNTAIVIYQNIESYDASALAGQNSTVQFQFYNNSGATITPTIQTCYASAKDNFTTCTADLAATNMQACTNGSTCTEAYTLAVSSNATNGYRVRFNFGAMTSAADIIEITGVDARATPTIATGTNASPPPIEQPTFAAEFARDTRYYFTTYGNGVAAATIATSGYFTDAPANCNFFSLGTYVFPTRMRAAPSVVFYSPGTGTTAKIYDYTGTTDVAANGGNISAGSISAQINNVGTTTDHNYEVHFTASSEL